MPKSQAAWRLFTISPDFTKLLAVTTLRKSVYLDGNVAEVREFEEVLDFVVLDRVTKNRGRVMDVIPSRDRRAVDICLTLMTSKPRSTSPSAMSLAGVFIGTCRITAMMRLSDLR
jgi:hypothetical protein